MVSFIFAVLYAFLFVRHEHLSDGNKGDLLTYLATCLTVTTCRPRDCLPKLIVINFHMSLEFL